jgi:ACS family glucarate transporter-like MFS transporter
MLTVQQAPPSRVRWLIFALACATSWLLYLHRYSWGVIKPAFQREHPDITATELGWLDAAFNASYALGQVPGGIAGDYFGARSVLTVVILLWSGAVAGVAWTGGFGKLFAVRSAFGLTQAAAYPVLGQVTRTWFPLSIRTSVQGTVTALGRVGAACSPLIVATLLMGAFSLSWRVALAVIAVPGMLLALAYWLAIRNSPREHPWCNPAEQLAIAEGAAPPAPGPAVPLLLRRAALLNLTMLLVYAFASTFQDQLFVNWIPLFLTEGKGLEDWEMGLFTPLPLLGGAAGGIFGGMLNDALLRRTGNRRWARSSIAFTGKLLAAGLIALSIQMTDGRIAMVVLLAARFFSDWSLATLWGTITDMGGRASGTVFGLINMFGAFGAFAAGPVMGFLKDHHGWEGLFLVTAAMCLLAAFAWLFINCTRRLVPD